MKIRSVLVATMLAATTLLGQSAAAIQLYGNTFGNVRSNVAYCSACYGDYRVWDQFTLSGASTINGIDALLYADDPAYTNGIEFSIWDASRTTELFAETFTGAQLNIVAAGGPSYDVSTTISNWNLGAGIYSLSIYANDPLYEFGWYVNGNPGNGFQTGGGGGTGREFSFRILGEPRSDVPEPMTTLLVGLGLASLLCARKLRIA